MKRAFVFLLVAGAIGAGASFAYSAVVPTEAENVCQGLRDQCGSRVDVDECVADLEGYPDHELEETARCIEQSDGCVQTVGCVAGSTMRDLSTGFFRGLAGP